MNSDNLEVDNLRALRASNVDAHVVLQTLQRDIEKIEHMYVVTIDKVGNPVMYMTASVEGLPLAVLCLQEHAMSYLRPEPRK